ncbi:MAG: nucleotide sugar dehydrogenase [Candidatus Hydrothermarchaeales archaeon]
MTGLERRIREKKAVIGVIGLGYVGLPLACLFAREGFTVLGADIKREIVDKINKGIAPINEPGLEGLLSDVVSRRRLVATTDGGKVVRKADAVFVVVQTPIGEDKLPDLSAFKAAFEDISKNLSKGDLIISESTIPPGTMKGVAAPILERSKLRAGEDFYLAYSPERAIPTKTLQEMQENERIVGGINPESAELSALLYSHITKGEIVKEDIETAEIVKVIENAYRDVNIAFANEIALLCEKLGISSKRAIELANRHPRVNILSPGPGVGGHCIPKDPYFLLHSAKKAGMELKLISSARQLNESMPSHVLKLIEGSLSEVGKDIKTAKVSILGIAYKGNTDDSRNSPAEPIVRRLMAENCNVISHDPYVTEDFGGSFSNDIEDAVRNSDCVVFLADHDAYRELNLQRFKGMLNSPCVVIDSRSLFEPRSFDEDGIRYVGLGK